MVAAKERKELKEEFKSLRSWCSLAASFRCCRLQASDFGFRVSFGFRPSDFGF
jgi:hypothetical protein